MEAIQILRRLHQYRAWSNRQLLHACRPLSRAQLDAPFEIGQGPQENVVKTADGALGLCANWVIASTTGGYFDRPAGTNALLHTWSLSVEEQFYLLFPAVLDTGPDQRTLRARGKLGAYSQITVWEALDKTPAEMERLG